HQDVGVRLGALDRWFLRRGLETPRYRKAHRHALPRAVEMLRSIGIADPEGIMRRYPHELSGGMRQRVMIAIALSCDPDLLVADEPTTALDVTIQAQIMDLMRSLKKRTNAAILLITHHLGVVAEMADRIAVMYAGRIVEVGPAKDVFKAPKHPYTLGLLNSIPDIKGSTRQADLPVIPGNVPNLLDPPAGCPYHPRCPFAFARCREKVPELQPADRQLVACHLYDEDVELPRAMREKDASVYLRPPEETAFAPNPRVRESEAGEGAVPG
ncbi:MAG TPA: ABC transporter ATP-binding protein, partial [Candidatus Thermoplasmatota archaeon]|nr:ABC transporter ATP-binding protein [Candidatus Thermoplasmatota archaeon]